MLNVQFGICNSNARSSYDFDWQILDSDHPLIRLRIIAFDRIIDSDSLFIRNTPLTSYNLPKTLNKNFESI